MPQVTWPCTPASSPQLDRTKINDVRERPDRQGASQPIGCTGRNRNRELLDIGKIRVVADTMRVTGPLLDVLEAFLDAFGQGQELHGWAIMRGTKRAGPTVYGVLERLEDRGWIVGSWEEQPPDANMPRRRYYRLTPNGKAFAEQTIAQRRPQPSRRPASGSTSCGACCAPSSPGVPDERRRVGAGRSRPAQPGHRRVQRTVPLAGPQAHPLGSAGSLPDPRGGAQRAHR